MFLCLDSDTAGSEACTRLAQSIPGEIAVIRLVPARKDWNDVLRQQGDIPSRKFIAETITLFPMLRMADVELTKMQQVIGFMREQEQTTDRSQKKSRQNSVEL